MIGPSGEPIARNGLYRRGTKSVVHFSWISWRSSSSPPLGLPQPPVSLPPVYPPSPTSPFPPFDLAACLCHPHEDRPFVRRHESQVRVVSVRAEACKQVRWMHSVHSTGFSSSSSITRRPLLHLLRACVLPSSLFLPFPHVLFAFSVYVSRPLSSTLVSSSYFGARVAIGLFP